MKTKMLIFSRYFLRHWDFAIGSVNKTNIQLEASRKRLISLDNSDQGGPSFWYLDWSFLWGTAITILFQKCFSIKLLNLNWISIEMFWLLFTTAYDWKKPEKVIKTSVMFIKPGNGTFSIKKYAKSV